MVHYWHAFLFSEIASLLGTDCPADLEIGLVTNEHADYVFISVSFYLFNQFLAQPSSQLYTSLKDLISVMSYTMIIPWAPL
jgi:hypothetical protein